MCPFCVFHLSKWSLCISSKDLITKHAHLFCSVCLTGCERLTWEVAELCWSKSMGSSQPWDTSVHTTEHPWSKVSDRYGFNTFSSIYYHTLDILVISCHSRCVVKRTRALSLARRVFQHCNRRHRGLPWAGQPAYLPGDLPRWCCLLTHSLPYHVSKHHQKVYTSLMSVCSRSELKRTRWSFVQTSR